jgi:ligand-binding SRPBCC domain-containing protein
MAVIHLQTVIDAPQERVFDLARSIDAHQDSAEGTSERAVGGVTTGLLGLDEEVTWEARHLGVTQRLRVKMTQFHRARHFQDVMLKGAFKRMQHDHTFETREGRTVMTDHFEFQSPLGFLGSIVDRLFLTSYLRRFLVRRNGVLKQMAESDGWKKYLQVPNKEG